MRSYQKYLKIEKKLTVFQKLYQMKKYYLKIVT